jgi:hypothetical protein
VAATNLANDPFTWLNLTDVSPIRVNDTIVYDQEDHVVVNVSPAGVKIKGDEGPVVMPPTTGFYQDDANLMLREPRVRKERTFFAFPAVPTKKKGTNDPLGLEMIGKTFFSTDDEPGSFPVNCTITSTGDPRKCVPPKGKRMVPILERVPTDLLGDPNAKVPEKEVQESTVNEGGARMDGFS